MSKLFEPIDKRYTESVGEDCCLSCGGAAKSARVEVGEVCVILGNSATTDVLKMAEGIGPMGFVYSVLMFNTLLQTAWFMHYLTTHQKEKK